MLRTFAIKQSFAWLAFQASPQIREIYRRRKGLLGALHPGQFQNWEHQVAAPPESARSLLQRDHAREILPGLLAYGDAVSMRSSVESRHPFLDYRLVELAFRYTESLSFSSNETKSVLRSYLMQQGQSRVARRHDKKGYPTPIVEWIIKDRADIVSLICNPNAKIREWCDPEKVSILFQRALNSDSEAAYYVYKLIALELWLSQHG